MFSVLVSYLALLLLTSILLVLFAINILKNNRNSNSKAFAMLTIFMIIWSVNSGISFFCQTIDEIMLCKKIEYIGVILVPVFWFVFVSLFTFHDKWLRKPGFYLIFLEPLFAFFAIWTNEKFHLFWRDVSIEKIESLFYLITVNNFGFWAHTVYSYFLIIIGALILIFSLIRFPSLYRGQFSALLLALFFPFIVNVFYVFRIFPFVNQVIDPTPLGFSLTILAIGWGMSNFKLLRIMPVAKDAIFENMSDIVIVIDQNNRIVDLNPVVGREFSLDYADAIGKKVDRLFKGWWGLLKYLEDSEIIHFNKEISYEKNGVTRDFDLQISPLRNRRNSLLGRLVVLHEITERKQAEVLRYNLQQLQETVDEIIQVIALIVEMRDPYTAGHQKRVAKLASEIARTMGLAEEQISQIRTASLVHDIGKIYIPVDILNKPGKINDIEYNMIKTHPQVSYDILKTIDFPWPIAQIVYQHHEREDGSGYPCGLTGSDILLEAKIIGVADVVEAMSIYRPYREALGLTAALEEIKKNSGILYETNIVEACLKVVTEGDYQFEAD